MVKSSKFWQVDALQTATGAADDTNDSAYLQEKKQLNVLH